jgi:glutathione S-transferase
MVLQVYGHYKSIATKRVLMVLYETCVPFQFVQVDILADTEHKGAQYLKKHPFGQIPYIVRQFLP